MTEPTRLFLGLKKFISDHVFKGEVKITNLPDVQRVAVENQLAPVESLKVSNLGELGKELTDKLQQVSSDLSKALKNLEDKPDDYTEIVNELNRVHTAITEKEIPQTELAPVISSLKNVVEVIKDSRVNVDLSSIERTLSEILETIPALEGIIEKGRVKVLLSDEQVKKMGGSFAVAAGGGMRAISSATDSIDTELPAAAALADGMANPTAPAVAAHLMASNGTTWDKVLEFNLEDANIGASNYLTLGAILLSRSPSGPVDLFTETNPGFAKLNLTGTYNSDASPDGDYGPVYAFTKIYDATAATNTKLRQAQETHGAAGMGATGLLANALYGQYDEASIDLAAENKFNPVRITQYKALHAHKRDNAGNELKEVDEATLLASAARTTTQTGADITNYSGFKYLHVVLDVTAITATPSLTLTIEGKDSASGKYYTILAGAAVTGVSTNVYRVGPGITPAVNATTDYTLPKVWRIVVTVADADSATYSVGYALTK